MSPRTPATVPGQRAAVGQREVDVDADRRRVGDLERHASAIWRTPSRIVLRARGIRQLPGRHQAARLLGPHARRPARAPASTPVEQPLTDPPPLERVELDRERVLDLVEALADEDPEPVAQQGPHRALDEPDEPVELDDRLVERRERRGQERPAAPGAAPSSARAPASDRRSKPQGRSAISAPAVKLRGSNGCSGWRRSAPARGVPVHACDRRRRAARRPARPAGGGTFVRSSLPL